MLRKMQSKSEADIPALDRAARIDTSLAENTVDADVSWFVAGLSAKQREYGIQLVNFGGDWRKAADAVGYGPSVSRETIEKGDVMEAYMKSIEATIATAAVLNSGIVVSRINRIALRAEQEGNLPVALAANKSIGDVFGIFEQKGAVIRANADGIQITISGTRDKKDDVIDADFEELLARNGRDDLVLALNGNTEQEVSVEPMDTNS